MKTSCPGLARKGTSYFARTLLLLLALTPALRSTQAGTTVTVGTGNVTLTDPTDYTDPTVSNLIKDGTGTVSLTGTSTYTGGTTINLGTLQIGAGGTIGSIIGDVTDSSILSFKRSNAYTFGGVISGSGSVQQNGTGALTLSGMNTYSGGTTLNAGTLNLNNALALGTGTLMIAKVSSLGNTSGTNLVLTTNNAEFWNANFTYSSGHQLTLGAGLVTMSATRSVSVTASPLTVGGVIAGTGTAVGLTKTGDGLLILTGNSTYAGTTTISGGGVRVGNGGTTGALGSGKIVNNITLIFQRSDAITVANNISGKGTVFQAGGSDLLISGNNTYTGGTVINGGSVTVGSATALGAASSSLDVNQTLNLNGNAITVGALTSSGGSVIKNDLGSATLTTNSKESTEVAGQIEDGTGTLALVKSGVGALTLSGANTYSHGTTLTAGTLNINNAAAIGAGMSALTIAGVSTIDNTSGASLTLTNNNAENWNANFTFKGTNDLNLGTGNVVMSATRTVTVTAGELAVGGEISGATTSTGLTKAGAGTLTLGGVNTYAGTTTISAGTLNLGGSLGTGKVVDNGTLRFTTDPLTFANAISGTGGIEQDGSPVTLTGANTYTGGTTITSGMLILGNATALGSAKGSVSVGDTLDLHGFSATVGGLTGGGTVENDAAATSSTLTVSNTTNASFAGTLANGTGTLALAKSGTGSLALSGTNTYSGDTTLTAGTLAINSAEAIGTGTLNINGVATLDNSSGSNVMLTSGNAQNWNANFTFKGANDLSFGTGAVNMNATRTVTVNGAGALNIGGVITGSTFAIGLTKAGTGTLILSGENSAGYTGITTITAGTLQIGDGSTTGQLGTANVVDNGTLAFNRSDGVTAANVISGKGGVVQAGSGNLQLNGANTYTGGTTINQGIVTLNSPQSLGAATGSLTLDAGLLDVNGVNLTVGALSNTSGNGVITNAGANATFTTNTSASTVYNGVLADGAGTLALVKSGTGALTLGGANTFSAGTTLNAGGLSYANASALGTGSLTIAGVSMIDNKSGDFLTLTNHAEFWNANFTFKGTDGSVNIGTGNVTLNATRTVTVSGNNLIVGGVISGPTDAGLIKDGAGGITLAANNTYTGTTTIKNGTINVGNGGGTGSLGTGNVVDNGVLNFGRTGTFSVSNVISGSGRVSKSNNGILTLTGTNTYSGGTLVSSGTLILGNAKALGAATGNLSFSTGTLDLNGFNLAVGTLSTTTGAGTITNNGANAILTSSSGSSGAYSGVIQNGTGTTALAKGGGGALTLSGANTYTGGTTLSAGTLALNNASAIGTGALVISGASTLDNTSGAPITLSTNNAQNWNANLTFKGSNDLNLGTGTVTMSATRTITTTANTLTIGGAINGLSSTYGLIKAGAGTLVLGGANTYVGGTTLNAGELDLNNASALGNGAFTIAAKTTLDNTSGASVALTTANSQNWNADFTFNGTNDLNLGTGAVVMSATRVLTVNASNLTVGGAIGGTMTTFGLTKAGAGTLTLSGQNTFTGVVTVSAGTLQIGNGTTNGSLASTSIVNSSILAFNDPVGAVFSTVISGHGSLQQNGTNILTLTGLNTYNGGSTVNSGTLQFGNANALGATSASVAINGGILDVNGFNVKVGTLSGLGGSITNNGTSAKLFTTTSNVSSTYGGAITDGVTTAQLSFTKAGTGTLTLTGASTATGKITISAGTLQLGNNGTTGTVATNSIVNSSILSINHSNAFNYSGVINGGGSVQQNGSGTTTLTGTNTYTGGTTVNSGTLAAGSANPFGSGDLTLNAGTLATNGIQHQINVGGDLKWSSSALIALTLTPDANSEFVAITGKLTALDSGSFTFNFTPVGLPPGDNDFTVLTSAHGFGTLTASDFVFISSDMGLKGIFSISGNNLIFEDGYDPGAGSASNDLGGGPQPVPEPSTWAMLMLGGAILLMVRRRSMHRA